MPISPRRKRSSSGAESSAPGNEGRARARGALLLAAAPVLLAFAGPLLSGERFYFRDVSQNHGPVIEGARSLLRAGVPPWWSPWAGGGEPLLANPNHLLMTPTGWLALLFTSSMGLTVGALLGALLGSVFLALLLMDMGRSPWAAATGAVVLGLSGWAISLGTLPNVVAAAAWIPAALFFIGRTRRSLAWLPAAVLAAAFVFAPCEPVSALVLCAFALLLSAAPRDDAASLLDGSREGRRGGVRDEDGDQSGPSGPLPAVPNGDHYRLTTTAWVLVLGLCASACQLFPAALWILNSARGTAVLGADASKWALSVWRLPEFLAPGFLGDPARFPSGWWSARLFETGLPLMLSLHVGGPVLLLSLWSVWKRSRTLAAKKGAIGTGATPGGRPGSAPAGEYGVVADGPEMPQRARASAPLFWRLGVLAVPLVGLGFLVLAILATPGRLSSFVPGAELFRYPEKFMLGAVLALALETAAGADRLLRCLGRLDGAAAARGIPALLRGEAGLLIRAATGLAIVILAGAMVVGRPLIMRWFSLPPEASVMIDAAHRGVRWSLWLGAGEILLFLLAIFVIDRAPRRAGGPVLASCVAITLLAGVVVPGAGPLPWRLRANPSVAASFYSSSPFFAERMERLRETGERVFRFDRPPGFAVRNRTGTIADGFQWDRRSLGRSSASEFGVELAYDRSTDHLDPRGSDAALSFITDRPLEQQVRFWSLASIRLILSYEPLQAPGLALLDRIDGESNVPLFLYENTLCLPRARLTSTLRSFPVESDEEAFERIARAVGDDWQEPQIEPPAGVVVDRSQLTRSRMTTPLPPVETGRPARLDERSASRMRIHVEAAASGAESGAERRPENLVLSENEVPGWHATLDGRPVRISRANGMHMSILIPDGATHDVVLTYFPPGLLAGSAISALALALAVLRAARGAGRAPAEPRPRLS